MVRLPQAVSEDLRTVSLAQVGILFVFLVLVTKGVVKCNVFVAYLHCVAAAYWETFGLLNFQREVWVALFAQRLQDSVNDCPLQLSCLDKCLSSPVMCVYIKFLVH